MASRFSVSAIFKAVDKMSAPISRMQNRIQRFTQSINRGLKNTSRSFGNVASSMDNAASRIGVLAKGGLSIIGTTAKVAGAGFLALAGSVALFTQKYSVLEDAEASFTPLLGGLDKAREMVRALNVDAEKTPFRFETLSDITKTLLPVMQGDIEKTRQAYKMLGDSAGGNAEKLKTITLGYTKALLKGKVDLESLNMIAEAGVPIFDQLAKSMGKNVDETFFKMISKGQVKVADLQKAFEKMTGEGGIFFKGMEIASQTTTGRWSTLMDIIDSVAEVIGKVLNPVVKTLISTMSDIGKRVKAFVEANEAFLQQKVETYFHKIVKGVQSFVVWLKQLNSEKPIIDRVSEGIQSLSFVLDGIKTVLFGVIENFSTIVKWTKIIGVGLGIFFTMHTVIGLISGALTLLNVIMMASPMGLILAGVAGTLLLIYTYWDDIIGVIKGAINYVIDFGKAISGKIFSGFTNMLSKLRFGVDVNKNPANDNNKEKININKPANFTPSIVTPEQRNVSVMESIQKNQTEITIKDDTGRAEISKKGNLNKSNNIKLQKTGSF